MQQIHVAAAILYRDGRVLACHRGTGSLTGWEFPGGKLEEGESAEQALRRELREELGMELQVVWLYDTVEYDYPDFHLTMDCFVCTPAPGVEPEARVHDDMRWLARAELADVDWLPADTALVEGLGLWWDVAFSEEHL